MSITAGFITGNGILLCADSQYSAGEKVYRRKLDTRAFGESMVSFAWAGDEDYSKTAVLDCYEAISRIPQSEQTIWSVRKAARRAIKRVIDEYAKRDSLDQSQRPQFLVAISTFAGQMLFSSRETAMPSVERFAFCGSGAYLGEYLMRCFSPMLIDMMTVEQAVLIGHFVLAVAKRHDNYCGGGSQFVVIRGMQASAIADHEFSAADDHVHKYEHLAKTFLMAICDSNLDTSGFNRQVKSFVRAARLMRKGLQKPGGYRALLASLRVHSKPITSPNDQT